MLQLVAQVEKILEEVVKDSKRGTQYSYSRGGKQVP